MTAKLSRRDMLKLSAGVAAGAVLVGCAPAATPAPTEAPKAEEPKTEEPTKAPEPTKEPEPAAPPEKKLEGTVVMMYSRGEFSEDEEAAFEAATPGVTVDFVDSMDLTRFFAMYAAGNPPDLMRVQAPSIPKFLARQLLYDLTPYYETSQVLKMDDLMPANNYYKANSPLEIGEGKIYGMVKDFSPDFTIFINTKPFQDAGVDLPDDTKALSYAEVQELARKLVKTEGDRVLTFGYYYESAWTDRIMMNNLAEKEMSLYSEGFDKIVLTGNEETKAIAKWYYDMAVDKLTYSAINPSPNGWGGTDFTANTLAMCQYGFWFSAMAETDANKGALMMLPGPTWSGVRRNPTMTATGTIMSAPTKNPDAAWALFEYYNGGDPAIARAKSGWGVPGLKSLLPLIPEEGDYKKQAKKVLQGELDLETSPMQFNPFLGETEVSTAFNKNLELAIKGEQTFDDMLAKVEEEVNQAIKDGIQAVMG
jgi:multiple sugar transport system substrate-binding protein